MTKPCQSTSRELFGILGAHPKKSEILKEWNKYFLEKGIDAFMDSYNVKEKDLLVHFSDMFLFDRRAYIVSPNLQKLVLPYLDVIDLASKEAGKASFIYNRGGVLIGYFFDDHSVDKILMFVDSKN
ncbi:MAG: hypothetical protein KAS32_18965 [Candidatus Peribacteraceae bacterium]|nr:hypothetical protein [Candidatus Peribacteraceae bacterium]